MEYMCVCEVLELYGGHSCHTRTLYRGLGWHTAIWRGCHL